MFVWEVVLRILRGLGEGFRKFFRGSQTYKKPIKHICKLTEF